MNAIKHENDNIRFGNYLRDMIKLRGYTQETFATKVGLSPLTISKYVNGSSYPKLRIRHVLARELGIPATYFDSARKVWESADPVIVGERLHNLLQENGMSQTKLATSINLFDSEISGFVNGTRSISYKHASLIAKVLNTTVDDILCIHELPEAQMIYLEQFVSKF